MLCTRDKTSRHVVKLFSFMRKTPRREGKHNGLIIAFTQYGLVYKLAFGKVFLWHQKHYISNDVDMFFF